MKICYIVAMVAEAQPFIERYGIQKVEGFFAPLPCQLYEGEVNGKNCKIEIPPTPEGYKLFRELLNNIFPVKDWTQDKNLNLN